MLLLAQHAGVGGHEPAVGGDGRVQQGGLAGVAGGDAGVAEGGGVGGDEAAQARRRELERAQVAAGEVAADGQEDLRRHGAQLGHRRRRRRRRAIRSIDVCGAAAGAGGRRAHK